jgi:RNA polymerase sigma-70 factor (ECF subfamily)
LKIRVSKCYAPMARKNRNAIPKICRDTLSSVKKTSSGEASSHEVTSLLRAWSAGDASALEQLTPLVYSQLRRLARRHMAGEKNRHALQTNDLVQEAYIRLLDAREIGWQDRAHFFAVSARLMRRILVDFARSRHRLKRRGSAEVQVDAFLLDEAPSVSSDPSPALVALDDALKSLTAMDERKGQIVELRFFGGLTAKETAVVLNVSEETVLRDWKLAKVWLSRELTARESNRS